MKVCSSCSEEKPLEDFAPVKGAKDGRRGQCRVCAHERWKVWYEKKGREENRARNKKYYQTVKGQENQKRKRLGRYSLSAEDFAALEEQHKVCPICRERDVAVIDHDHSTGRVRGLLCSECNTGLGMFKDNPEALRRAVEYLSLSMPSR